MSPRFEVSSSAAVSPNFQTHSQFEIRKLSQECALAATTHKGIDMEFVKVKYYRRRTVYIDGDKSGFTNKLLKVNRGTHKFELSPPANYTPDSYKPFVKDTIPARPLIIEFEPIS